MGLDGAVRLRRHVRDASRHLDHQHNHEDVEAHRAREHRAGAGEGVISRIDEPIALHALRPGHGAIGSEPFDERKEVRRHPRGVVRVAVAVGAG